VNHQTNLCTDFQQFAVKDARLDVCKYLITAHADVDTVCKTADPRDYTSARPLLRFMPHEQSRFLGEAPELVQACRRILVEAGADPTMTCSQTWSPWYDAVYTSDIVSGLFSFLVQVSDTRFAAVFSASSRLSRGLYRHKRIFK